MNGGVCNVIGIKLADRCDFGPNSGFTALRIVVRMRHTPLFAFRPISNLNVDRIEEFGKHLEA